MKNGFSNNQAHVLVEMELIFINKKLNKVIIMVNVFIKKLYYSRLNDCALQNFKELKLCMS